MLVFNYLLLTVLTAFIVGILGLGDYQEVFDTCKKHYSDRQNKYLSGNTYKTKDLIFRYTRFNQNKKKCTGSLYLNVQGINSNNRADIQSIAQQFYNLAAGTQTEVYEKIDPDGLVKLKRKVSECKVKLDSDNIGNRDKQECIDLLTCHEYDFSVASQTRQTRQSNFSKSTNLLRGEIICDSSKNTFSKVASSLVEKMSEAIHSSFDDVIHFGEFQDSGNGHASNSSFKFLHTGLDKHLERNESDWIAVSVSPQDGYKKLNLNFSYVIPKAKLEFLNYTDATTLEGERICGELDSNIEVAMTLSMVFEKNSCKTLISEQRVLSKEVVPRNFCEEDHLGASSRKKKKRSLKDQLQAIQRLNFMVDAFVFTGVTSLVLERIKTVTEPRLQTMINCEDFRLA